MITNEQAAKIKIGDVIEYKIDIESQGRVVKIYTNDEYNLMNGRYETTYAFEVRGEYGRTETVEAYDIFHVRRS